MATNKLNKHTNKRRASNPASSTSLTHNISAIDPYTNLALIATMIPTYDRLVALIGSLHSFTSCAEAGDIQVTCASMNSYLVLQQLESLEQHAIYVGGDADTQPKKHPRPPRRPIRLLSPPPAPPTPTTTSTLTTRWWKWTPAADSTFNDVTQISSPSSPTNQPRSNAIWSTSAHHSGRRRSSLQESMPENHMQRPRPVLLVA